MISCLLKLLSRARYFVQLRHECCLGLLWPCMYPKKGQVYDVVACFDFNIVFSFPDTFFHWLLTSQLSHFRCSLWMMAEPTSLRNTDARWLPPPRYLSESVPRCVLSLSQRRVFEFCETACVPTLTTRDSPVFLVSPRSKKKYTPCLGQSIAPIELTRHLVPSTLFSRCIIIS